MSKKAGIFIGLVACTALGFSVAALLVKADERRVLNDTFEMIRQHIVDGEFADIVERYNEDGDAP